MPEVILDREIRIGGECELEIEERADGTESPTITGYAAIFNKLSVDLGGFRERIAPGAFSRALEEGHDVRALVGHDPDKVLGRAKSGTLTMEQNTKGLKVRIKPPDTQAGRDIVTSIRRGDVSQMSFAFKTIEDAWNTEDGGEIRTLKDVELFDVSPVTFPAYPDTTVAARSMEAVANERKAREEMKAAAIRRQAAIETRIRHERLAGELSGLTLGERPSSI